VIHTSGRSDRDYLIVGVVRGIPSEVSPAIELLDRFAPDAIGLGLSPDELGGLTEHFVGTSTEPVVPLATTEAAEVLGLVRFGEVQVPNPAFVRVIEWAQQKGVPIEAVDTPDEGYVNMFTDHIGYVELVRRTLRERKLTKRPPQAATPDDYVLNWDRQRSPGDDSVRFAIAREASLVREVKGLAPGKGRVAVLVDRERFDRVVSILGVPPPVGGTRVSG
jgi:hypothetical protein